MIVKVGRKAAAARLGVAWLESATMKQVALIPSLGVSCRPSNLLQRTKSPYRLPACQSRQHRISTKSTTLARNFSATSYEATVDVENVSAEQFFIVVRDVPSYPSFVKWINSTTTISRTDANNFEAEMTVNFMMYKGVFESKVKCTINEGVYEIVSVSKNTPVFESMVSVWRMSSIGKDRCKVDYSIEFKFKNMLYQSASSYFIGVIGQATMNSFISRARDLHEKDNRQNKNLRLEEVKQKKERAIVGQSEASFEFLAKRQDIELEILIFQTVEMLNKDELLSDNKFAQFKELYFSDKNFAFEMKTLFQTFPTREQILSNKERIVFLLKRHLANHITEL